MHKSYSEMKRELANIRADIDQFMGSHGIEATPMDDTRTRLVTILACYDGIEDGADELASDHAKMIQRARAYKIYMVILSMAYPLIFFITLWLLRR